MLVALLAVPATVSADMMPMSGSDTGCRQATLVGAPDGLAGASLPITSISHGDALAWSFGSIDFLPEISAAAATTCETQPQVVLAGDPSSLSLCLYALLSLFLCKSAASMAKLQFNCCLPDWYEVSGRYQIGHGQALSIDCHPVPVYCLVQPRSYAAGFSARSGRGVVMSLWRGSQFTPAVIAPRGPPHIL